MERQNPSLRRTDPRLTAEENEQVVEGMKRKAEAAKKQAIKEAQFKRDMVKLVNTEEGVAFFRYLKEFCAWDESSVVCNRQTGEMLMASTAHDVALRSVYGHIRKLIPRERLMLIEFPEPQVEGD